MDYNKILLLFVFLTVLVMQFISVESKEVRVRLHVPKHIKTIYKTKIIKVPEHHHYIHHEKKEEDEFDDVKVPEYHHFFHDQDQQSHESKIHKHHSKYHDKYRDKFRSNHRYDDSEEDDKKLTLEEVRLILENAGRLARYGSHKRYHIDPNLK